jgi:hypothetical protein
MIPAFAATGVRAAAKATAVRTFIKRVIDLFLFEGRVEYPLLHREAARIRIIPVEKCVYSMTLVTLSSVANDSWYDMAPIKNTRWVAA